MGGASADSGSESTGGLGGPGPRSLSPRTLTDAAGTLVLCSTAFLRSRTVEFSGSVTSKASERHLSAKVMEAAGEEEEEEVGSAMVFECFFFFFGL